MSLLLLLPRLLIVALLLGYILRICIVLLTGCVVVVHSATVVGSRAVVVGVHSAAVVVVVGGFGVPSFSRDSKQLTNIFFKNVAKF